MEETGANKTHVVVFPSNGQGHINPMLQFSKRLASKGLKVTVTTVRSVLSKMPLGASSVTFEMIYDDCIEGGVRGAGGFKGFLDRFEASGTKNLTELIRKSANSDFPVKCLIYDASLPWALSIAKKFGISTAAFFTQSCAAVAGYYPMYLDLTEDSLSMPALISMSSWPEIKVPNVPSFGSDAGRYSPILRHILNQFNNIGEADWVLFNSFDKLEEEVLQWMSNLWPVRTIGPTIPSSYLDKRMPNDDNYGFNLHKPDSESCLNWLNTKETKSVIYISFGSVVNLSKEQTAELAEAIARNNYSFLWVAKPSEETNLPRDFPQKTSEKGLVVNWCPQLEVLAHPAVGCFVTHCGWNSTMEAISFGVPMVAMPQLLDQMTNAYFVEKVWGVGVGPMVDERGVAGLEEIRRCIGKVMGGESGREVKKNALRWKELAVEAVGEGGSSDMFIDEIVACVVAA